MYNYYCYYYVQTASLQLPHFAEICVVTVTAAKSFYVIGIIIIIIIINAQIKVTLSQ